MRNLPGKPTQNMVLNECGGVREKAEMNLVRVADTVLVQGRGMGCVAVGCLHSSPQ